MSIEINIPYLLSKSNLVDECLVWQGRKTPRGYGLLYNDKYAHREMYRLRHQEIDPNLDVMHFCDTPGCINPWHLSQGTRSENMIQCSQRDRKTQATVTVKDVREIRSIYNSQDYYGLQIKLAKRFNTTRQVIDRIVRNITWRHIS